MSITVTELADMRNRIRSHAKGHSRHVDSAALVAAGALTQLLLNMQREGLSCLYSESLRRVNFLDEAQKLLNAPGGLQAGRVTVNLPDGLVVQLWIEEDFAKSTSTPILAGLLEDAHKAVTSQLYGEPLE